MPKRQPIHDMSIYWSSSRFLSLIALSRGSFRRFDSPLAQLMPVDQRFDLFKWFISSCIQSELFRIISANNFAWILADLRATGMKSFKRALISRLQFVALFEFFLPAYLHSNSVPSVAEFQARVGSARQHVRGVLRIR